MATIFESINNAQITIESLIAEAEAVRVIEGTATSERLSEGFVTRICPAQASAHPNSFMRTEDFWLIVALTERR
jgi:hypothetical protein